MRHIRRSLESEMASKPEKPKTRIHAGKTVLLVISGGIAAYKALELIRLLRRSGIAVTGVLTGAAQQFVTPLSVAGLSGSKVYADLFSLTDEAEMGHIELSRSADLVAVVPASADLLAKMAHGLADDLASTLLLATDKKILAAPAMNLRMWLHPATRRNVQQLEKDGVHIIGPDNGEMACGEFGPGRMAEPAQIHARMLSLLETETQIPLPDGLTGSEPRPLAGTHVLITSGPTHEPIDPVRYIANRSSGRQGHAIAAAAAKAGARVTLVSGPVSIPYPKGVEVVETETARDMLSAVEAALPADIFVAAAAVADWRVADTQNGKIKKAAGTVPALNLVENPDILHIIANRKSKRPETVVGFAAETSDLLKNAKTKLQRKGCDLIVANDVSPQAGVMGGAKNTVHLVSKKGVESWPTLAKEEVAERLIELLAKEYRATSRKRRRP
jgi:phosphopantothenoylcysteine decarboxylase/phosphopantothenate--cysteine ligase